MKTVISEQINTLRTLCRKQAAARTAFYNLAYYGATTILPLCLGIYLSVNGGVPFLGATPARISIWDCIAILLLAIDIVFVLFLMWAGKVDLVQQLFDFEDAQDQVGALEQRIEQSNHRVIELSTFVERLKTVLDLEQLFLCKQDAFKGWSFEDVLSTILKPILPFMPDVFNYPFGSYYNFSIYLLNPATGTLDCAFRWRDARLDEEKGDELSRSWPIGVGHIGRCFASNRAFRVPDLTLDPDYGQFDLKPGDGDHYRAAMSVPLRRIGDLPPQNGDLNVDKEKYGVLIMTSSRPDQFSPLYLELLRVLKYCLQDVVDAYATKERTCRPEE